MAQATSGEKLITIDGQKYKVRTQVVYQDGLGVPGTLSTTAPIRYVVEYLPPPSPLDPFPVWTQLGERDNTSQSNWSFTPAAGAGFKKALVEKGPNSLTASLDDSTVNALSSAAGVTKQQARLTLDVAPNLAATAPAPDPVAPNLPSTTSFQEAVQTPLQNTEIEGTASADFSKVEMIYPSNLSKSTQDYLQITALEYRARTLGTTGKNFDFKKISQGFTPRDKTIRRGTCYLPIQPIILDQNIVNWGPENMDAFSALFAQASYAIANNPGQALKGFQDFTGALGVLGGDPNIQNALRLYLAGRAVGNQSFFTRITGAIVNPNLELLFNGPTLRTFNYSFRLSPRNTKEAKSVKTIIRFFKEMSAVRTANNAIFLRSPNVFQIKYVKAGSGQHHTSLNRVKTCALTSMTVNYTPDNSYMTFTDTEATMTSYDMALTFQELEPVYDRDYQQFADKSVIGF